MAQVGDKVKIVTHDGEEEGILMQSPREDAVLIKLSSGYNLGFKKSEVKKIELVAARPADEHEDEASLEQSSSDKPIVSILHTGGTIASKVDYTTGGVASRFTPEELLSLFPELSTICQVRSRLMKNMWSQDMRFSHYNLIAAEIEKEVAAGAAGVIVTQGTDTLHYTAAALSFMLEHLPIPVLLVGAQRSSDRGSSDAGLNLLNAAYFITKSDFAQVGVCMHAHMDDDVCAILPGTKCRKLHTSRRDAFRAVNTSAWAHVDYRSDKIDWLRSGYLKRGDADKLRVHLFAEDVKVGLLKQHTNMHAEQFLLYKDYDGLVIESTGLGCLPMTCIDESTKESERIAQALGMLLSRGVVICEAAQTIFGRLNMHVYEDQRRALEMGVLGSGNDMTPATSFIKLAWLLSNYSKDEARKLFLENLRGELSENIEVVEDFLA